MTTVRHTFRALAARNYRLYFIGQVISVSGTWMQAIALTWLVLRLGGSGLVLGLTAALQYLPLLVFGAMAGVVVDRFDKRRLLFVTQSAAALVALAVGALIATGAIQLWMVVAAAFTLGVVNALDVPTRQTFAYELVGPELLANAVTLNSVVMNVGRVVGPTIAGIAIATVGLAACFFLNAASYLTLIGALLLMNTSRLVRTEPVPRRKGQLREGLRYVIATPPVRTPLLAMAIIGTFTYEFQVMLPVHARFTFGSDAAGFGLLMAAMGIGSVVGGLIGAAVIRPSAHRLGIAGFTLGLLVMLTAVMPTLQTTAIVLVAVGAVSITFITMSNATLQLTAAPEMRGRVVALYTVALLGSIPIGGPIMGGIAQAFGGRVALGLAGAIATITMVALWRTLTADAPRELVVVSPARATANPRPAIVDGEVGRVHLPRLRPAA